MDISGIDDIDKMLLHLLKENARYTYSYLAEKAGISRVAEKNRIQNMEDVGLIRGYDVKLAPGQIDNSVGFIVNVSPQPEHFSSVLDILGKSQHITRLHTITGMSRMVAIGVAPNPREMDAFYRKLSKMLGNTRYFSFDVIASTYKDVDGGILYDSEQSSTENA